MRYQKKTKTSLKRLVNILMVSQFGLFLTIIPLFLGVLGITGFSKQKISAAPIYSVSWNKGQVGQYPLTLKSDWFKAYETKKTKGKKNIADGSIPFSKAQVTTDGSTTTDTMVYVTIKANSFKANKECELQIIVSRPIPSESSVIVRARSVKDGKPPCSDELVSTMNGTSGNDTAVNEDGVVVEPDGDNIVGSPENNPNADTEEDAKKDREAVTKAEDGLKKGQDSLCKQHFKLNTGWIVCSALELLSDNMEKLKEAIDSLLNVNVIKLNVDGGSELHSSWSYFRAFASFMLLVIGLVMVLSQAINKN